MIHVQQIFTEWTDDPAMQAEEDKRRDIAEALRVPYFEPHYEGVWHRVRHRQKEKYQCTEFVNELKVTGSLRLGSMLISDTGALLLVDFIWTQDVTGSPRRESRQGFRLQFGQIGRFKYNGKFDDPKRAGGHVFQKMVFNVFYGQTLTTNTFLNDEPFHVFDETVGDLD